jgi:hypothetical protein
VYTETFGRRTKSALRNGRNRKPSRRAGCAYLVYNGGEIGGPCVGLLDQPLAASSTDHLGRHHCTTISAKLLATSPRFGQRGLGALRNRLGSMLGIRKAGAAQSDLQARHFGFECIERGGDHVFDVTQVSVICSHNDLWRTVPPTFIPSCFVSTHGACRHL